jgi:hypothetical protein
MTKFVFKRTIFLPLKLIGMTYQQAKDKIETLSYLLEPQNNKRGVPLKKIIPAPIDCDVISYIVNKGGSSIMDETKDYGILLLYAKGQIILFDWYADND